ncbi:unnamed protein product [Thelazia callipaeda]|uniref:Uncharacterized protein n=1 Tax=Thelazia callipaeda TaxID=103827 RepID=A0A0N5CNB4_THECL|nr:unnamed protein product [Thelazia callipaeda]
MAHQEELFAVKKYFKETHSREINFCENLKNFLETQNIYENISDSINDGNLLTAIEKLMKVESIRYHLLSIAKSHDNYDNIIKLITPYYNQLEDIYANFLKEAKYYCSRGIDIIRGKNQETKKQLEVVLRAVELDNKVDKLYENNLFKIVNRPHCWRQMLFDIVEERIQQRIEAFQIEDRKLNKNWLIRYGD